MHRISVLLHFAFFFSSLVLRVVGHGFVHTLEAGGQAYPGWNPFSDPYDNPPPRVVRKVASDGFVSATDADLACHHDGDVGTAAIAQAPSGSQVTFQWTYWPAGTNHQGPVSTYMTSCNGNCTSFSANDAKWFKVDASGYSNGQWAATTLIADNASWTSTIPSNLAPGQYLMRNEIVALHSITPQFYPSCSQIEVTGSGTGVPSSANLMTMQEVYSNVSWPDIYLDTNLGAFIVPGPPPAQLGGGGASTGTGIPTATGQPSTITPSTAVSTKMATSTSTSVQVTTTASSPSNTGGQCVLKARRLVRRSLA